MEIMTEDKKTLSSEEVAAKGVEIYEKIKSQYEPEHNGKFLVIDIETGKAYMSERAALAMQMADMEHPGHQGFVLRIGYEASFILH
jgi:hypothetical protein